MYNTKLMNWRYEVECIALSRVIKIQRFIVDTGAMYSCCHYSTIDERLKESEVLNMKTKFFGGLISGVMVKFYEYPLKQFTIGNINMGVRHIWVTFDQRVIDRVLGLDILKDVIFLNRPASGEICFFENETDCEEYIQTI